MLWVYGEEHIKRTLMNQNNFWSSTIVFGCGFLFIRAVSFLLLPIHTNILDPNSLGYIFIFITFLAFMNALYSFGMDSALLKFYNKNNKILFTSIIGSFIFIIPISAVIYLTSDYIKLILFSQSLNISSTILNSNSWIFCSIVILACDVVSSRIMVLCRILNLPWYYLLVASINIVTSIGLNIYFLYFKNPAMQFDGVILAMLIVSIVQLLFLLPLFIIQTSYWQFKYKYFKQMFNFAWPFFPATIFFIIIELVDRVMIENLLSTHDVGLYGAGYKVGALMLMIVRGFNLSWQPYYLNTANKTDSELISNFSHIGNIVMVVLIFISGLISSIWPFLLNISVGSFKILGASFVDGGEIIPYILLSYTFYGVFILQMPSIYLKNKQNWAPVFWGMGALINIIGNIVLLPLMGFVGAAISTLLAYFAMAVAIIWKNYSWLWIPYNYKILFMSAGISLSSYLLIVKFEYNVLLILGIYVCTMLKIIYTTHSQHRLT